MAIHAAGLKSFFPDNLKLVSGPGCPVCVTEKRFIDHAILIGQKYDACLVTFGDLIKVPGSLGSLATFRSEGGAVRVVYSPLDSIEIALQQPGRPTVFLGVGFETTIPTVAATLKTAKVRGIENFFVTARIQDHTPSAKGAGRKRGPARLPVAGSRFRNHRCGFV